MVPIVAGDFRMTPGDVQVKKRLRFGNRGLFRFGISPAVAGSAVSGPVRW